MPQASSTINRDQSAEATVPAGFRRLSRVNVPVSIIAAIVSLLCLIPLVFVIFVAVDAGWSTVSALVFRPRVGELLLNTALLECLALPLAVVLAVSQAWLTERTDLPLAGPCSALAVAPLAIPAFVHSYGWISAAPGLHGLPAAILVSVFAYSPFLYLPVAAQLRRLDPALEEAAASLGKPPAYVFFFVVLPQLRVAILAGSVLIGLHLMAEYGLYAMIRFDTFATAIVDQFQSSYNSPAANLLGGVLVSCCAVLITLEVLLRGKARFARVGAGALRPPVKQRLGAGRIPALLLPASAAALGLGVPLFTIFRWLAFGGLSVWPPMEIGQAFVETLLLAVVGGALATVVAGPAAWLSIRAPGRIQQLIEACHFYVGSLPGVIVALALVTLTVRVAFPLYQTYATLLFAYVLMFLPRAMAGLRASLSQVPVELEQAATALGRSSSTVLRRITVRLAAPGIGAGMVLVALGIANELTATLMLSPNGTRTLATEFWAKTSELDYAAAAPYAVMMIAISLPFSLMLQTQTKRILGQ